MTSNSTHTTRTPPEPEISKRKGFLPGLDPLRAFAALSVCLFHYTNGMLPKLIVPETKAAFSKGVLGVIVFFVISGFIIPYSLVGKNHQISGFFAYMKKRIIRINPPAYASLLLVLGESFIVTKVIHRAAHEQFDFSFVRLFHNLLFTIPFTKYDWINGVFWTLAIEFQFYIFIGLFFALLFERKLVWFVVLFLGVNMLRYVPFFQNAQFLTYSSVFAIGGVALLWHQKRINLPQYIIGLLFFGGMAVWQLDMDCAIVSVGTAIAINTLTFSIPAFSFLGKISYSLYLVHPTVGTSLEFILIKLVPPTSDARKVMLTLVCLAITIAAAYIFHLLVERPFMKWASQNRN